MLLRKSYSTYGLSYMKGVVPKPTGQQLSNLLVVYNIDVWLTSVVFLFHTVLRCSSTESLYRPGSFIIILWALLLCRATIKQVVGEFPGRCT